MRIEKRYVDDFLIAENEMIAVLLQDTSTVLKLVKEIEMSD
jgi:hypothetical protein